MHNRASAHQATPPGGHRILEIVRCRHIRQPGHGPGLKVSEKQPRHVTSRKRPENLPGIGNAPANAAPTELQL